MVERIASMLNYLLLQLVGPNKNNFKVSLFYKTCMRVWNITIYIVIVKFANYEI